MTRFASGNLWVFVVALAAFVLLPLGSARASDELDRFVQEELSASGVPGITYGAVIDGEIRAAQWGEVEKGSNTPVTAQTGFLTGSVTKSFTALAIMQLVEAGDVALDAPVSTYLDIFADGAPQAAITVRQLLSHTSGYSTLQGNMAHEGLELSDAPLAQRAQDIAALTPAHLPGDQWEYSNANYVLAGRVIETVSALSYADYITQNVLVPAGMTNSFVNTGPRDPRLAIGHKPWLGSKRAIKADDTGTDDADVSGGRARALAYAPQGGLVSTGGDLALYLAMMMNGEDDLITAQAKKLMMRPANDASPYYGLGWFLDPETGLVYHSGNSPGFEALASMIPAQRKGAANMVNAASGIGFGETGYLRSGVNAIALGLENDGVRASWGPKSFYLMVMSGPLIFILCMMWAWHHRAAIRAKTGPMRIVSIWLPLITTSALAASVVLVVPRVFGASLRTIYTFVPDMGLAMIGVAVLGVMWAVMRIVIAYTGPSSVPRPDGV